MTMHRPIHADAKTTIETEVLSLRQRLAKAHRILTAGGIWPLTKGHVSARIPGTDKVLILGHIHSEGRSLIDTDVDDLVTVDMNGRVRTGSVGIPLGVLVQVFPFLAAEVRVGYHHVFGAYSSADYVPIGFDLLASTGTMDLIISVEMPRKLQAASNMYEGRVQLQARF